MDSIGSEQFNYESLSDWTESQREEIKSLAEEIARRKLSALLGAAGAWVFADGRSRQEGILIRSTVLFWSIVPCLQGLSQVQLAEFLGLKHKQSIGRHVSEFRDTFPTLVPPSAQKDSARESCRQREQKKKS